MGGVAGGREGCRDGILCVLVGARLSLKEADVPDFARRTVRRSSEENSFRQLV